MKLKALLLGSAAAFAVVGGAQAADLSIAEPVDYVRVCDAIGAGYWYIPGGDTCLKIGGYVQFDVNLHSNSLISTGHSASWDFKSEFGLSATAKSMRSPEALMPSSNMMSNSASRNGGAILFLTTRARTRLPTLRSASLMAPIRRMSIRTEE